MSGVRNKFILAAAMAGTLGLAGCGGSSGGGEATGYLSLGVSDSPIHDAEKVCITFDTIEIKKAEDEPFIVDLDPAEKVNLLAFQGANAASLLFDYELEAGEYEWLRLGVDASMGSNGGAGDTGGEGCDGEASYLVMEGGTVHNIFIPSGDQTGLKLVRGFTVPVNDVADFTAEWDLQRSIVAPPGLSPDVLMKPVIRLVDNAEVGTLAGQIDAALLESCPAPSVYLFDDGVTPNPIEEGVEDPEDPVATALVEERMNGSGVAEYHYEIGFIVPGSYEAAFTCDDGESFVPEDGKEAVIEAQTETTVDFTEADLPAAETT